ncbi:MAG: hypothetical protein SCK29_01960 [Bacillota bacterium]|nr:hypothetical protein [Bacillota bacterium]
MALILGILFGGIGILYRLLITSDIPISYSTSEAITVHIMIAISTFLFFIASSNLKNNKSRIIMGFVFLLLFFLDLFILLIYQLRSVFFTSSFAQLETSSILSYGMISAFNFYQMLKEKIEK